MFAQTMPIEIRLVQCRPGFAVCPRFVCCAGRRRTRVLDLQVFARYQRVVFAEGGACLVRVVAAGIGDVGVDPVGSGLGLYMARSVIDVYGGSVTAQNVAPHGAEFRIWLPAGCRAGKYVAPNVINSDNSSE